MSVTDELRGWFARELASWHLARERFDELTAIADRIDERHERALRESYDCGYASADDWLAQHEDAMAEHGWVRLPLDADGVPIRVGDRLDGYNRTITVQEMVWCGMYRWSMMDEYGKEWHDCAAFSHHHAPTVEDVLREFAEKITDSQIPNVHPTYEEAIAEYAAKLRLAEEEDDDDH